VRWKHNIEPFFNFVFNLALLKISSCYSVNVDESVWIWSNGGMTLTRVKEVFIQKPV
jgi:hypothetical protein